jgi:hypothetical protein
MSEAHASDSIILFLDAARPATILGAEAISMHDREHVISVVLTDEEWKAFLQVQPEPVTWIRERIQERINADRRPAEAQKPQAASVA